MVKATQSGADWQLRLTEREKSPRPYAESNERSGRRCHGVTRDDRSKHVIARRAVAAEDLRVRADHERSCLAALATCPFEQAGLMSLYSAKRDEWPEQQSAIERAASSKAFLGKKCQEQPRRGMVLALAYAKII